MKKQNLAQLSSEERIEKVFAWAAARCSLREYCRTDIRQKCFERGLNREETERVVERLEDANFLDETRYARAFVHDKTLYDRWGRIKTRQALAVKGIPAATIDDALAQIDDAAYRDALAALLEAKARTLTEPSPQKRRDKLLRFAAQRGYEPDLIFSLLD